MSFNRGGYRHPVRGGGAYRLRRNWQDGLIIV
jgi:hypothetical protein